MRQKMKLSALALAVAFAGGANADDDHKDFGQMVENLLHTETEKLFGFEHALPRSADASDYVARELATAGQRILLADGLKAEFVTRNVAKSGDMISFYPSADNYTHLIVCIEQGRAAGGINAGVQRIEVATGKVENIVYGMSVCDGIRTTPWGTILATEEAGSQGRAYEILDPLNTTGHWVANRATGDVRDGINSATVSNKVVQRPKLGSFSWEGLEVIETGVVIAGDELSPSNGNEGGAIFKFIPSAPRMPGSGNIADLSDSPLADGNLYALRVVSGSHYGQAMERGAARWIGPVDWDDVNNANDKTSRQWALDNNATGFYRPEDLHADWTYTGQGVKVLWTNTGVESGRNYAEVMSMVEPEPLSAASVVEVQRFIEGDTRANSFDNLDIQPKTGNVYVIEDHDYGEIWACLQDGGDRNLQSDGCVSAASVVDPDGEPTGFIFDASGKTAYVIVQHGECPAALLDMNSNPVNGCTDDVIKITGFEVRGEHASIND